MRARFALSLSSALLALATACGPGASSDFCVQALEDHAACLTATAAEDCEAANDECPGEVLVAESCPVQFSCP